MNRSQSLKWFPLPRLSIVQPDIKELKGLRNKRKGLNRYVRRVGSNYVLLKEHDHGGRPDVSSSSFHRVQSSGYRPWVLRIYGPTPFGHWFVRLTQSDFLSVSRPVSPVQETGCIPHRCSLRPDSPLLYSLETSVLKVIIYRRISKNGQNK